MPVPEKIVIDGKEYSVKDNPELLALVQEVRKEEKDKLYSTISSKEAQIKVLEDEKKKTGELSAQKEEELKKAKDELAVAKADKEKLEEEMKKGKKGGADDDDDDDDDNKGKKGKKPQSGLSKEEVAQMIADAVKQEREAGDRKVEEVKKSLEGKKVGDYRKEQLAKYKDVIIEDFVPENLDSEEAVNKAIQTAIEKSKNYIRKEYEVEGTKKQLTLAEIEELEAKAKDKKDPDDGGGSGSGGSGKQKAPDKPDGGSGDLTGKELLSRIEDMSDEEYAKHADAILKEVKSVKYQDGE